MALGPYPPLAAASRSDRRSRLACGAWYPANHGQWWVCTGINCFVLKESVPKNCNSPSLSPTILASFFFSFFQNRHFDLPTSIWRLNSYLSFKKINLIPQVLFLDQIHPYTNVMFHSTMEQTRKVLFTLDCFLSFTICMLRKAGTLYIKLEDRTMDMLCPITDYNESWGAAKEGRFVVIRWWI